jgi:hypothetical protein
MGFVEIKKLGTPINRNVSPAAQETWQAYPLRNMLFDVPTDKLTFGRRIYSVPNGQNTFAE